MSYAKTAKEVLIATKWILENVGWCQHSVSKLNQDGDAIAFCLAGAFDRVHVDNPSVKDKAWEVIRSVTPGKYPVQFNDDLLTNKELIIKMLNKAIRKAK